MNIINIPNIESKEDILKRLAEYITKKDVIISKNIVAKLFGDSSMEYEGNETYCIIQLTWYEDNSKKMIKFHTHKDEFYLVDWIYINDEFKSCNAMFGITDGRVFFEMN